MGLTAPGSDAFYAASSTAQVFFLGVLWKVHWEVFSSLPFSLDKTHRNQVIFDSSGTIQKYMEKREGILKRERGHNLCISFFKQKAKNQLYRSDLQSELAADPSTACSFFTTEEFALRRQKLPLEKTCKRTPQHKQKPDCSWRKRQKQFQLNRSWRRKEEALGHQV